MYILFHLTPGIDPVNLGSPERYAEGPGWRQMARSGHSGWVESNRQTQAGAEGAEESDMARVGPLNSPASCRYR